MRSAAPDTVLSMRRLTWIAVALVAVAVASVLVLQPTVKDCYYVLGEQLLEPGETPAPTPTGMENGYYCVPPE